MYMAVYFTPPVVIFWILGFYHPGWYIHCGGGGGGSVHRIHADKVGGCFRIPDYSPPPGAKL